jgi:NADH-quinone oxidoreductase subunit L
MPATNLSTAAPSEIIFQLVAVVITLLGIYAGYQLYYKSPAVIEKWKQIPAMVWLRDFWFTGWGFDALYNAIFVRPFVFITQLNKSDVIDRFYNGIASVSRRLNRWFSISQNGSLRWYVAGVLVGILFILTLQLVL